MTPRVRKLLVVLLVVAGIAGVVLGAISLNLIRLGPASVDLPPDALTIYAFWYRFPDGDPEYDYYSIVVQVTNRAGSSSVVPYLVEVNISVTGGQALDHTPMAGDHTAEEDLPLSWGGSPPDISLHLPTGYVAIQDGGSYMQWSVIGKRGLASQPVFTDHADFYAEFRVSENASLEGHPEVAVGWYYANPLQAYPVASQAGDVLCAYTPSTDSEGTAPHAGCS